MKRAVLMIKNSSFHYSHTPSQLLLDYKLANKKNILKFVY